MLEVSSKLDCNGLLGFAMSSSSTAVAAFARRLGSIVLIDQLTRVECLLQNNRPVKSVEVIPCCDEMTEGKFLRLNPIGFYNRL